MRIPGISLENVGERLVYWSTIGVNFLPPNRSRSIFVLGYPRTGTNWLVALLHDYFGIPMSEPWTRKTPDLRPVIMHLHRFSIVRKRTVYMIRDPRDIVISHYHKILADPNSPMRPIAERFCGAPLVHANVRENLEGYVRFLFDPSQLASIPIDRHLRKARRMNLYTARYEDMLADGEETLTGIVRHLSGGEVDPGRVRKALEATSFEKVTGRKRGEEDVSAAIGRKGIAGEWESSFTPEAAKTFARLAGDLLIETGYESDHAWVDRVGEIG